MLKINLIRVKFKRGVSQGSKTLEKQECCLSLIVRANFSCPILASIHRMNSSGVRLA